MVGKLFRLDWGKFCELKTGKQASPYLICVIVYAKREFMYNTVE
jgi:hypothetical protein